MFGLRFFSSASTRLDKSVFWGFTAGFAYTLLDSYLDNTFGVQVSAPVRPVEVLHAIIDFVLPAITGALLGVAVHYVRLRAKMAELEKRRADDLTGDLHKIQRDQAVWVISASLLHELKNPLHALGLLLDEVLDEDNAEPEHQKQLLLRARTQVERITRELATLRALPSSTPPEVPSVNLEGIVREACGAFSQKSPHIPMVFHVEPNQDSATRANPAYVRIILENLLENAADALSMGNVPIEPRIEVSLIRDGSWCRVEVSDNGPGVDAETRKRLFEPLKTTKLKGMGLGLSIARALARAMGGDLQMVEQPVGVKFRLSLGVGGVAS